LRKYYFTNIALNIWNSLPNHVVLSDTVNTFKSRLDKFWQHRNVIYDFKAEIHGTGSRSCYYILLLVLVLVIVFWNIRCAHRGIALRSSFHYVYVYVYECRGFRFIGGPFAQAFYTELIQPAIWPQQMGRKLGAVSLWGRGPGSPSNTMWLGPRPTGIPSFILIHTTV